jgi:acyl-[acyl-carrier-protein]-phospholipid O-acyltransferase/long-chain-fatty-acid--[acyl-carrier-protein] ligase
LVSRDCPGTRIGVLLPPSSAAVIANLGAWLAGKQVLNLSVAAGPQGLASTCRQAGIAQVVTSQRYRDKLARRGIDSDRAFTHMTLLDIEDALVAQPRWRQLAALLAAILAPSWLLIAASGSRRVHPDDTAAILISSAETPGHHKAVELSHRNIGANVGQIADVLNPESDDALLASLPLSHAYGLTVTTALPLLGGVPMVCHPDPADALGVAKAIARFRVTMLCSSSSFLQDVLTHPSIHPMMLEPLRLVIAGTERLSPEVREGFALRFNKPVFEGYGATETTPIASLNLPDALETRHWKVQTGCKPGTVGLPLPGTCFRIVDPETLAARPTDHEGLVLIGGVPIMKGYLDDPQRTAEVVIELDGQRWFKTGDRGRLDSDGFLTITGQRVGLARMAAHTTEDPH